MEKEEVGSGAPPANAGGEGDKSGGNEPEVVSKDFHRKELDKVLADLHKWKSKAKESTEALESRKTEELKSKEQFKELYESESNKAKDLEKKYEDLQLWMVQTQREDKVREEAMKVGLRPESLEDLRLIDLSDVAVKAADGRFIVEGAKERVERLKSERPHWFKPVQPPNVNPGSGAPNTGSNHPTELTASYMNELERKNPSEYVRLFPEYKKQAVDRMKSK